MTQTQALEQATAEYVAKLKALFGPKAKANISIEGVSVTAIAQIASECRDDEGEPLYVRTGKNVWTGRPYNYVFTNMNGEGFEIEQISE